MWERCSLLPNLDPNVVLSSFHADPSEECFVADIGVSFVMVMVFCCATRSFQFNSCFVTVDFKVTARQIQIQNCNQARIAAVALLFTVSEVSN